MSIINELKRRNVFRIGIAYVLMGWVLLQGADFAFDLIGAPNWVIQSLFVVVLIGLPIALFMAWAFELTPEGIKREADVDRSESITPNTGRKLDRAIIVFLALALVLVLGERMFLSGDSNPDHSVSDAPSEVAPTDTPQPPDKSIAVLPFADLSQAQDQAWFADGLAEEILNALVRVPDLQVTARTSTFQYRGSTLPITEIAQQLGVAHVLEGSVRSSGDRIRVTAQLIRASDGFHLWSENYDRDVSDMISIQEDLATSIATALETSMDPAALEQMSRVGTTSIEAYQAYLRGRQLQQEALTTSEGTEIFEAAYQQFELARGIDPTFAAAHVQAADYWKVELTPSRTDTGSAGLTPREALREYHERIGLGIQNSITEEDRVRSLADRALVDLRLNEARRLFNQYLDLRPNDEPARFELLTVLGMLSDTPSRLELLAHWKKKGETDYYSASAYINEAYRVVDPAEAAEFGMQALQRWPNGTGLIYQTHRTLMWAGRYDEASELAARYATLEPGSNPLVLAREACGAGNRAAAEAILANLETDRTNYLSSIWLINNMLGNKYEETESLRGLENNGVPFSLASFLGYHKFDPKPFPSLMAILEREGVTRPEPVETPFQCPPAEQTSIAVLPFVNMSSDAEQEYFSDGISEEILNALVKLEGLKVAGRTSSFSFKGKNDDLRTIGDALGVNHILEGSVRKSGDQVRITAQLIQVSDGFHLWSETYTRELDDIFAVQDEISQAIVDQLEVALSAEEAEQLVSRPTENIEAYNKYLQARQLWHLRGRTGLASAAALLEQVVVMDPSFARAWAALADTHILLPEYGAGNTRHHAEVARDAVNRALELEPNMAQALTTRAYISALHDFDYEGAYRDFNRAIELEPTYPTAHQWYGEFLATQRKTEEALARYRKAATLDPLAPIMWHAAGWTASAAERNEESIGYYKKALEIAPAFEVTHANLTRVYTKMGQYDLARQHADRYAAITGSAPAELGIMDAMEDPQLKQALLDDMKTLPIYLDGALFNAFDYMLLGEPELAMESMEKAFEDGDPYAIHANSIILFEPLRENPRFQAHLAKMNLWPPVEESP